MKNTETKINISFQDSRFECSGAFNSYSVRSIDDNIILFAFILKDLNGSILSSHSYSIFASSLEQNRDAFWRYLRNRKEEDVSLNEPTFVFSNVKNIEIIHANTNGASCEISLVNFSLNDLTNKVNDSKKKKQSIINYNNAFIVATHKSSNIVHKSFIKKLLEELENIRGKSSNE